MVPLVLSKGEINMEKFIVVTDKPSIKESLYRKQMQEISNDFPGEMKIFNTKKEAIGFIAGVGLDEKDPRKVKSIFTVNDQGLVIFYSVEFNGKFELVKTESKEEVFNDL